MVNFSFMPGLLHCLMSQVSAHISSRRLEKIPHGAFPASWFDRLSLHASSWLLVSLPRGGEFRVHHIQFPNQLLSPQEAMCCIIKRDAFNHSIIFKHSSPQKKKKKWRGGHYTTVLYTLHCVNSFSSYFSSPSMNSLIIFGEHKHLLFCEFYLYLKRGAFAFTWNGY